MDYNIEVTCDKLAVPASQMLIDSDHCEISKKSGSFETMARDGTHEVITQHP